MRLVTLKRRPSTEQGTLGEWTIYELALAWTSLELPWHDNEPRFSCIPAGRYYCELQPATKWSPRDDGRIYHILNVPGRTAIEIHAATWAGDVRRGWHSDLLGCVALGTRSGFLIPPDGERSQLAVLQSRIALKQFMDALRGQPFDLKVSWAEAA